MFNKRIFLVILVLLANVAIANPANNQILALTESKRKEIFTAFMKQSGENCVVNKTFLQGKSKNGDAFWNVGCTNNKSFVVEIKNNSTGSTKILECGVYKMVTKLECFKAF